VVSEDEHQVAQSHKVDEPPELLRWARSLQAIAQSGLAWEPSEFDGERYVEVRRVAAEMLAHRGPLDADGVDGLFASQVGHATPKLDVRGAVFREDAILLVQESAKRVWSLPGGWVDVGESPSEAVAREVLEESGYAVRAVKLLGLYDRDRHSYPPHVWHIWRAFFLCELEHPEPQPLGHETVAAGFFRRNELPDPLIFEAARASIERCFDYMEHPEWATDFD
jgi:ADP-ribose pyrophosphatase YjhB (NUDIX family)